MNYRISVPLSFLTFCSSKSHPWLTYARYKVPLFVILHHKVARKHKKNYILWQSEEEELRSVSAGGRKLLFSPVLRQQILLYRLAVAVVGMVSAKSVRIVMYCRAELVANSLLVD